MTSPVVVVIIGLALAMLVVAAALTLVRMARGPGTLDRVIASDVMIAAVIAAMAAEAALNKHTSTLVVILVLTLLAFAGSLSVARFVADRDRATRRTKKTGDVHWEDRR